MFERNANPADEAALFLHKTRGFDLEQLKHLRKQVHHLRAEGQWPAGTGGPVAPGKWHTRREPGPQSLESPPPKRSRDRAPTER